MGSANLPAPDIIAQEIVEDLEVFHFARLSGFESRIVRKLSNTMPRNYASLPWKKTFQKCPAHIEAILAGSDSPHVLVACSKTISEQTIRSGTFKHLYVDEENGFTDDWKWLIPSPNIGPASYRNATPLEERVESMGKIAKRIRGRAPNWKGGGFHTTTYERPVWFTRLSVPAMLRIGYRRIGPATTEGIPVRFQIEEALDRQDVAFTKELLHRINLLQENVGATDLYPSDVASAEFLARAAEEMAWDVLVDSKLNDELAAIARKIEALQSAQARRALDRLAAIRALKPQRMWHSKRGYVGYFMVEFADTLTIFEHLEVDNAMYVAHEKAEELSKLTRSQLRGKLGAGVERIVHSPGWERRLERLVKEARGEPLDELL